MIVVVHKAKVSNPESLKQYKLFSALMYGVNKMPSRSSGCHEVHVVRNMERPTIACNGKKPDMVTFKISGEATMSDLFQKSIVALDEGDCKDPECRKIPHEEEGVGLCRRCFLHCQEFSDASSSG